MTSQATGQNWRFDGSKLKAEMDRVGWNDERVAVEVNVRVKSIERWRRSEFEPRFSNVLALARVFERDPAWFYEQGEKAA